MGTKPEEFITALYPVDDIWVLFEDDDERAKTAPRRKTPAYGAERARFLALCADGKIRAVIFDEMEYTLEDFGDGVCNWGIYTGEGLARFMPKARISFWDGSKDPRPDFLKNQDALTDDLPPISDYWNTLLERCCKRLYPMYRVFLRQCNGMTFIDGTLTIYVPDLTTLRRLENDSVKNVLQEESGARCVSFLL